MEIKEVLLDSELNKVKSFLDFFNLKLTQVEKTFYMEDNDKVIGTISVYKDVVKCFAVDSSYADLNIASTLISNVISYFQANNITSYKVYTKPIYKDKFTSFGFRLIAKTAKVAFLEGGVETINDSIEKLKVSINFRFGDVDESSDIACIVVNANPITNGHMMLIEKASKEHNMVLVMVVEEDESFFSFKERLSLVYIACKRLENVYVIPSTKYVVSLGTFPSYFLNGDDEVAEEAALVDAIIFKDYFMKNLYIKKRYVGSETKPTMVIYNNTLKSVLGENLEVVERLVQEGQVVSASTVRMLLNYNMLDEALEYMPRETYPVMLSMRSRWKEN